MDVNDTLVLILERIDSPVSLVHAASTCRRWRRLITNAGFLRRYRSLHGPPVAGDYYNGDGDHNYDDYPNRRLRPSFVSSSCIDARHFSLDYVVDASIFPPRCRDYYQSWDVQDSRSSLILMECYHCGGSSRVFPDLVVCEPLTQRYRIIPQPPDFDSANCKLGHAFLVDGDEDEAGRCISMSNFRVLCVLTSRDDGVALARTTLFTAGGDADTMWSEKGIDHIASMLHSRSIKFIQLGRMLGSCYFYLPKDGSLITYDGSIGKFSLSMLPQAIKNCYDARIWASNFEIVNGGDREPRIVTILDHMMEVFARVDGEWKFENKVLLSKATSGLPGYQPSFFNKHLTIVKRGVGFVVISPIQGRHQWPFSVDLKTMEVAPAARGKERWMGYQFEFPWPPVLQVCVDR